MVISSTLAVLAALIWALSIVNIRRGLCSSNFISVSLVITIVGAAILVPLSLVSTPIESINVHGFLLFMLAGFFSPGLVRLLYFKGMEKVGASANASIYASYPVFSSLLATLLLGEELTVKVWIGVICVVLGAMIVQKAMHNDAAIKGGPRDLAYSLMAAISSGLAFVFKKEGLNVCDLPILGTATGYVVAILLYLPITLKRPALLNKEAFKLFWGPSVGLCAGHLLVFYALKFGEVSRVTPLLQLEPLFIIFLVRYYLKGVEETPFRLIIGALMIILGATLVILD
jgi:drug/metabolite transporter (DMT)-like permease